MKKMLTLLSLSIPAVVLIAGCAVKEAARRPVGVEEPPVADLGIPPKAEWRATASAVENDKYTAGDACDGNMETRWSSPGDEPHWLQFDLGRPATICGCTIHWENAFGSGYQVRTSMDGEAWETVYETMHGDGRKDDIFFRPVTARFVKVVGTERGTFTWGFSIHEVDLKGLDGQVQTSVEGQDSMETLNLFDGRFGTVWKSPRPAPCSIDVDLRADKALGGVWIDWGENYGTRADLLVSKDGESWEKVADMSNGKGTSDVLLHERRDARHIRIDIREAAQNAPVEIREISLCSPGGSDDPLLQYKFAAKKRRKGLYPLQFLKQQVFWTLVGMPGDPEESLLDEFGNFEPKMKSSSLMPYIEIDGKILSALDGDGCTHGLARNCLPLPTLTWDLEPISVDVRALARGKAGDSATYVLYTLKNESDRPQRGRFYLVVRPVQINPVWQYGGLSPIESLEYRDTGIGTGVYVNDRLEYVSLTPAAGTAARRFDNGDIMEDLLRDEFPQSEGLRDAGNLISGALAYDLDLAPGAQTCVLVAAPLYDSTTDMEAFAQDLTAARDDVRAAFERERSTQERFWADLVERVTIDLPQKEVADMMKTQVSYILINRDGPAIQPGSRNYNRAWIRDGCMTCGALLRMGLVDEVREYLDWYAERVQEDGCVPPILNNDGQLNEGFGADNEYDSQGEYIFAMMDYYRFTKDRAFLEKHFETMVGSMKYMITLRNQTLVPGYMADEPAPERFAGILPKSISHEGYNPPVHSYWDDFFALKGWKDGAEAARVLGRDDVEEWAEEQYCVFRRSLKESMEKTIAFKDIEYVPASADYGDCDPTSTAIAFFPCGEGDLADRERMRRTFDRYYKDLRSRFTSSWQGGFTPYEIRSTLAFVELGQKERAAELLDYMTSCCRPRGWNHLAEVVYSDPRKGAYIGDMPHTWVGSGYVNSVRGMLATEKGDKLILLAGAPESWLEGDGITIADLPTGFGTLDLKARMEGRVLKVEIGGSLDVREGMELYWPKGAQPAEVTIDGERWSQFDEKCVQIPGTARTIEARWM